MVVRVVRLGSHRVKDEGTRIGTVRRPPRGVPKAAFASRNWYDVWFPNLAPSVETMKSAEATTPTVAGFLKKYRAEMATPRTAGLDVPGALAACELPSAATAKTSRVAIADPARLARRERREARVAWISPSDRASEAAACSSAISAADCLRAGHQRGGRSRPAGWLPRARPRASSPDHRYFWK